MYWVQNSLECKEEATLPVLSSPSVCFKSGAVRCSHVMTSTFFLWVSAASHGLKCLDPMFFFFPSQGLATVAMASFTRAQPMLQHPGFPARSGVTRCAWVWDPPNGELCSRFAFLRSFPKSGSPVLVKGMRREQVAFILELTGVLQPHHISICKFRFLCQHALSVILAGDWKSVSRKDSVLLHSFGCFFHFVLLLIGGKIMLKH